MSTGYRVQIGGNLNNPYAVSRSNPFPIKLEPVAATLVSGSATASGTTVIGTPTPNTNLRHLIISITESATLATAGENLLTISLNGATVFTEKVYIPSSKGNNSLLYHRDIPFDFVAFNSGDSGTLTATLGITLSTGELYVNGYFG